MRARRAAAVAALGFALLLSGCGSRTATGNAGSSAAQSVPAPSPSADPTPTTVGTAPAGFPLGLIGTGLGSALIPPGGPVTKTIAAEENPRCYGLADAGYGFQSCVRISSPLGTVIAFAEVLGGRERSLVYSVTGDTADLALRASRSLPASPSGSDSFNPNATQVLVSRVTSDGSATIVFYRPVTSTNGAPTAFETVDVVAADGRVVLHRNLAGGVARRAPGGGLETWTPAPPGNADHAVFQDEDGAWRLTVSDVVSDADIPTDTGTF